MEDSLIAAWNTHNRIQVFVLQALPEANLVDTAQPRGKTVGEQFAHMHNVRLMWLKASAPELLNGLNKLEKSDALSTSSLRDALLASGNAIAELLRQALASGGRVKGFKPDAAAFVGYLISHESFHAGKIDMTLRIAGHPMDDKTHYGMWEWGVR